jgi:hypothetical protein
MRRGLIAPLLVVVFLLGFVAGGLTSSNWYQDVMVSDATERDIGASINQGGWEPVPGSFRSGRTVFLRKPVIDLRPPSVQRR